MTERSGSEPLVEGQAIKDAVGNVIGGMAISRCCREASVFDAPDDVEVLELRIGLTEKLADYAQRPPVYNPVTKKGMYDPQYPLHDMGVSYDLASAEAAFEQMTRAQQLLQEAAEIREAALQHEMDADLGVEHVFAEGAATLGSEDGKMYVQSLLEKAKALERKAYNLRQEAMRPHKQKPRGPSKLLAYLGFLPSDR
jgi:hypothetical protein